MIKFFTAAIVLFALVSCKHKTDFSSLKEVSYSTEIVPIINANCTFSGCHGASEAESFKLLSYNDVMDAGVKEGSPEKSKFYNSLKSLKQEKIMPRLPYSPLTDAQILSIYVWIGQGAKNN
jgi:hypothetical protein